MLEQANNLIQGQNTQHRLNLQGEYSLNFLTVIVLATATLSSE